jgi:MOSC domain-containing protein YiiM
MHVVSTNVGDAVTITFNGKEVHTGIFKHPVSGPIRLGKEDVEGDSVIDRRHHGGLDKACYLYSADHYPFWRGLYPHLDWQWGMFGENLTVAGLDESELRIGDTFRIGTAIVQVSQPRQPCFKHGVRFGDPDAVKKFIEAEKPGVYVRVLEEGV